LTIVAIGTRALARPGRSVYHPLQSNAEIQTGYSYNSTAPKCLYSMVEGDLYLIIIIISSSSSSSSSSMFLGITLYVNVDFVQVKTVGLYRKQSRSKGRASRPRRKDVAGIIGNKVQVNPCLHR
jgi:hypothetical protein